MVRLALLVSDNGAGVATLYNVPAQQPNSVTINPRIVKERCELGLGT
jgi:hypothetical protein